MPHFCSDEDKFYFPPATDADEDGLLLIGGRVTPERVIESYTKGIFPWYNETEPPLWWSPDPRFVLFPQNLHISSSMAKLIRKNSFQFTVNKAFEEVIINCATIDRKGQQGSWITAEMKHTYIGLYQKGIAYSAEAWKDRTLVGGMYGLLIGKMFFAESMFATQSNASKFAFVSFVQMLLRNGIVLIDCQVYSQHVESLGARLIPRHIYLEYLQKLVRPSADCGTKTA